MEPVELSVVIVNWNTRQMTCDCIRSVLAHADGLAVEVVLVDNGSDDGTVDAVRREFPGVVVVANSENLGFAAANNAGCAVARGRFLLLLNSDTLIRDRALQFARDTLSADDSIGCLGVRLLNRDGSLQPSILRYPSLRRNAMNRLLRLVPGKGAWKHRYGSPAVDLDHDRAHEVEYVRGAFMAIPRDVFAAVGGFDTRFFMYGEEADLCLRIRGLGRRVVYRPDAEIVHFGGGSSAAISDLSFERRIRSQLLFVAKHSHPLSTSIYLLGMAMAQVVRLLGGGHSRSRARAQLALIREHAAGRRDA